jgi:hypothetical protein
VAICVYYALGIVVRLEATVGVEWKYMDVYCSVAAYYNQQLRTELYT